MDRQVLGCIKICICYEDDSYKDITQVVYKVLNSWTVMEEKPKENAT